MVATKPIKELLSRLPDKADEQNILIALVSVGIQLCSLDILVYLDTELSKLFVRF